MAPRTKATAPDRASIEQRRGQWYGRVSLGEGRRPWVPLGPATGAGALSEAKASEKLRALVETGRANGTLEALVARLRERMAPRRKAGPPVEAAPGSTVKDVGEAWTSGKLLARYGRVNGLRPSTATSGHARTIGQRLEKYAYKAIGEKHVAAVTEQDIERILAALPEELTGLTRLQIHSHLSMLFRLAEYPLRLRPEGSNPAKRYLRPAKDEQDKLFSYLLPPELLAVLRCPTVEVGRRVLYALAVYTGLRKGSLFALTWKHVDLENGTIAALRTKTGVALYFEIDPGLVWVLAKWRERCGHPSGDELVVRDLDCPKGREAQTLRADLRAAGVAREILFSDDGNVEPLRFHDARATFATWAKRAGKGDGWITDRTGHVTAKMLARYSRAARTLEDLRIVPFPSLVGSIPELSTDPSTPPPNGHLGPEQSTAGGASEAETKPFGGGRGESHSRGLGFDPPQVHEIAIVIEPGGGEVDRQVDTGPLPAADAIEAALVAGLDAARAERRWGDVADLGRALADRERSLAAVTRIDGVSVRRPR